MSISLPTFTNTEKSVGVTVINNTAFSLDPVGNAQTNGSNSGPPRTVGANTAGSGGTFGGIGSVTFVTAYGTPDPNYIWVLFCDTLPTGTQTVKTAFFPANTMIDQVLVQDIQGSGNFGANASHKYIAGGVSITLDSRGIPGRGTAPSPSFYLSYTMAVSVSIANNLDVPLSSVSPISSAQTIGYSTRPPATINANGTGSGGTFEGTAGITAVIVYSTPDPNTVWALFLDTSYNGVQTVKTAFLPTGTAVDQKLVQNIKSSTAIGPNSSHSYMSGGASAILDSHGIPGGDKEPFLSFEINSAEAVGVSITNNLPVSLVPISSIATPRTAGHSASPPSTVDACSMGNGGIFRGNNGITLVIGYSTPDPDRLWVLFLSSRPNEAQQVKTVFLPTSTTVDQTLIEYIQESTHIGPNSSHSYTLEGVSIILDSLGTLGTDATPSPSFAIKPRMPSGVTIINNLPVSIDPVGHIADTQTNGDKYSPPTTIKANSMGSGGDFGGTDRITVVIVYSTPDPSTVWILFFNSTPIGTQTVKTAFLPSTSKDDQNLVEYLQGTNFGPNCSYSYASGGASVMLDSRGIAGAGDTPSPSFQLNYTMTVGVTITNNLAVPLRRATPISNAQTNGNNSRPPHTIDANDIGSGGIFKGTNGITAAIVYFIPDPNYVWVLFFNSPANGPQTVKTTFLPIGTTVDQKLVQSIQSSTQIGPDSSHKYTSGGVPITLNSYATPGKGRTPSPSFQMNYSI